MTHRKPDAGNPFPEIDLETASNLEIIGWLSEIIHNEQQKPFEEQDLDLISECLDFIDEFPIEEIAYTEEDIQKSLSEFPAHREGNAAQVLSKPKRKRKPLKVAIIVAASFAAIFMSLTVAAVSTGYSNAWEFVSQNFERFFNMAQGKESHENGILYVKGGESIAYDSIEDLLNGENIDILYPSVLPDGIRLEKFSYHDTNDGKYTLALTFNDINLSISIYNTYKILDGDLSELKKHPTSETTFYIRKITDQSYAATAHLNGYEYQIHFNDYNNLILILDNMKGFDS